ncbi:translation initiation factor IF-2-like [Pipra filicauda]|uniref:Translation initiation factor IF-2-like n=1 Tax=Pipra filicauda TaxID=649802 RepID=A0A7R5L0U2_9PASS|nr:translation initiation factor IF-2-like [Pipra filicauda]
MPPLFRCLPVPLRQRPPLLQPRRRPASEAGKLFLADEEPGTLPASCLPPVPCLMARIQEKEKLERERKGKQGKKIKTSTKKAAPHQGWFHSAAASKPRRAHVYICLQRHPRSAPAACPAPEPGSPRSAAGPAGQGKRPGAWPPAPGAMRRDPSTALLGGLGTVPLLGPGPGGDPAPCPCPLARRREPGRSGARHRVAPGQVPGLAGHRQELPIWLCNAAQAIGAKP